MKKKVIFAILVVAGAAVGYILVSPLFITEEVNESVEDIIKQEEAGNGGVEQAQQETGGQEEQIETIATGAFLGVGGHSSSGNATLLKIGNSYYVRFEENFKVTNGPDLFVHLGRNGEYAAEARLGSLKGNAGSQNYKVPDSIDVSEYGEVWVWCRAFSVPFAKATFVTP